MGKIENFSISVEPPTALSGDEWRALQELHLQSLCAIPGVEYERACQIVGWNDPVGYRTTRKHPETLVAAGLWNKAVFNKVLVSRLFEGEDVISATVSHDTASPPLMRVKILLPPRLPVPIVGGRRYAHLREIYSHPDIDGDLAFVGLWHALDKRNPNQTMTTYLTPADPADQEMVEAARKLDLAGPSDQTKQLPGYESDTLVRVSAKVCAVMNKIVELPGLITAVQEVKPTT